jgi:ATP-dependent Clp protease ATP-binding subunit ClpC
VRLKCHTATPEIKKLEAELTRLEQEKEGAVKTQDYDNAARVKRQQNEIRERLEKARAEWSGLASNAELVVDEDEIARTVADWTGIPVAKLAVSEGERLLKLEEIMHKRIVGQEAAISAVAKAVRRGRVGLKNPKRPIGSFMFLGPTGVGKTEACRALAETLFGDEDAVIRVDMSEYMEGHSVSKMIGSPPGYVGFEEGGQLSEKVRRKPYSVILFDEIEKAHPDVFNVLLQVLDDGRVTDAQGRKADFKNTVIIMTSNAGARAIVEPKRLGFSNADDAERDYGAMKRAVMDEVKRVFRPEFINRIDEIVVFHQLTKENIVEITGLLLSEAVKRAKDSLGIELIVSKELTEKIAADGYDPVYGARPLRRAVQSAVEDLLAEKALSGAISAGDSVEAVMEDGKPGVRINGRT